MADFTAEEHQYILEQFNELLRVSNKGQDSEQRNLIIKAFNLAKEAHGNMRRKSGEPYILHPIAVAKIATQEIGLGTKSIVSALLHDVVEDTDISLEDIELQFGPRIASIVNGLTKISGAFENRANLQSENFRKVIMTMAEDMRVIIIKLADRLHNMRTLDSMPTNKQVKIAGETLFIYSPLAHRLGLYAVKTELEDLCLKYLHPKEYNEISQKITESEKKRLTYINRFALPINNTLNKLGIDYEITGRPKSIYSIWNKMHTKKVTFEEVFDLFAIRIIFIPKEGMSEKNQCWEIYSAVTDLYVPRTDRIRDWVSKPKANGYEALHLTVMGPGGQWVEVQIRSKRMNEIAEKGYAAHWKYKGDTSQESELDKWIRNIREMLVDPDPDAFDFIDDFKLNLYSSEIMVFTPKGDIITLPANSTVLDFAFHIHTEVGYHAAGAKVNHKFVPLNYVLKGGDQVEIITSQQKEPDYSALDYVVTAKARSRLKASLSDKRRLISNEGKAHLEYLIEELGMQPNSTIFRKLFNHFQTRNKDKLYYLIGKEKITKEVFQNILKKRSQNKWIKFWSIEALSKKNAAEKFDKSKKLVVDDNTTNYHTAKCCNPIPGDDVIGYRISEDELVIHKASCPNALKLHSSESENVVSVEWTTHKILAFLARIELKGIDSVGIVNRVTKVISEELSVNMRAINIESHDGIFEGIIDVYIHNSNDLNNLIQNLAKVKGVTRAARSEIRE